MKFTADIKELPERFVACVRHIGPYPQIGQALEKIMQWASGKGLLGAPDALVLAVYHDSPETVDVSKLRSDACITVPPSTRPEGDVVTMRIPGGCFAVARAEIDISEYGAAWDRLIGEWIPHHGVASDGSRMCYEVYLNDPDQHPQKKHIVEICEPVCSPAGAGRHAAR